MQASALKWVSPLPVCVSASNMPSFIKDAFVLANFLGRPDVTKNTLSTALKVYDAVRRPFSQNVAAVSRMSGKTAHFDTPEFESLTEEQSASGEALSLDQLRETVAKLGKLGDWRLKSQVTEDLSDAFRKLDAALGGN